METLFEKLASFTKSNKIKYVTINWHGGEPMLMGLKFYANVIDLQKKYIKNVELVHKMQSNVTLYKGNLRKVLKKLLNSRIIGTSLDPFHPTRSILNGENYYIKCLEGIYLLLKDGFQVSVIYVVHKKSLKVVEKLYYFFKNINIHYVRFLPLLDMTDPQYMITAEEWGVFLKELYDIWENDNFSYIISPLFEWKKAILENVPVRSCESGPISKSGLHLIMSHDGLLYACDRFQIKRTHCIGNIMQMDFDEIINHKETYYVYKKKQLLPKECQICNFSRICMSGCAALHDDTGKTMWCNGIKNTLIHLHSKLTKFMD